MLIFFLLSISTKAASADNSKFPFGCPVKEGYVNVTGGKVWYEIVGSGDAIPLIVLHGGPGFTHDYLEPLGALCKERPVVFYDQLGAGKSDRPHDKSLWTVDHFVKELAQLRTALGLKRVHILGHSSGTVLLTDYALTQPQGVVSVIFSAPSTRAPLSNTTSCTCAGSRYGPTLSNVRSPDTMTRSTSRCRAPMSSHALET
jgi:pimeloyl-ACP methyl ester carboxylesterase